MHLYLYIKQKDNVLPESMNHLIKCWRDGIEKKADDENFEVKYRWHDNHEIHLHDQNNNLQLQSVFYDRMQ